MAGRAKREKGVEASPVLSRQKTQLPAPPSFFKIMFDTSLKGRSMRLPHRFASGARNLVDQDSYLEDTSGRRWPVKLRRVNGSLVFTYGWRKFVQDHSLQFGDLLVFRFIDSAAHFLVEIFGTNACEKLNETANPGASQGNDQNLPKKQRVSGSDARGSPPGCSNFDSSQALGGYDKDQSCSRRLKPSVSRRGRPAKRNTPLPPLVQSLRIGSKESL